MEGVTDLAVRLWFALTAPPDFVWTPFLRVTDTFPSSRIPQEYIPEQTILKGAVPFPVIPQLMGSRPEDFIRVAHGILDDAPFVDLNCGCPSPTVVGSRAGSSLLERVEFFQSFVESVVRACGSQRVSVKMRLGYHDSSEFEALIDSISHLSLAQLTIHGRTRPQRYTGSSDWQKIRFASEQMPFPVVGSGDVTHHDRLSSLHASTPRVKTVIIGRGALRNPWIFGDISNVPLLQPLVTFGLLQQLGLYAPDRLLSWAAEGGAAKPAGNNVDAWRKTIDKLQYRIGNQTAKIEDIEIDPRAFARVKMLWNYFRSSLPPAFMEPTILRAKSLSEFIHHLQEICRSTDLDAEAVSLRYRGDLDWLYSGQGKHAHQGSVESNAQNT